ncbi:MAG TPA: DNA helicase RecQ [Planctomycetaceae bacterium]|nr:DNA helicase RecQ [Planctomycetaceae bacterium]
MRTANVPSSPQESGLGELLAAIRRHWGFDTLRPLQAAAMKAVVDGRDSLLVLPTGGGKSLCYQAPAVVRGDMTVVVSPLIALMKDQVDGLKASGVAAVALNSSQTTAEQRAGEKAALAGSIRLLFASPERLATSSFRSLLKQIGVKRFAIDEAHCISHWGHDFRPDYRQLGELKKRFPSASIHAFTATATRQVRADIVTQLGLESPEVLVGDFDRPNLTYNVVPRESEFDQTLELLGRHKGEAGIIYCLRRRDVDDLTQLLKGQGVNAVPYHAGMEAADRKRVHDLFSEEKCDVVVATVAFGMGIDRSNIRYVLHTGMPKSIEHYQQETGRAGRDGLEAECTLLYSAADVMLWKKLMKKSVGASEAPVDPQYLENAYRHLADIENYCRPVKCRHRSLVEYFGQQYASDKCGACDLCLGKSEPLAEAQTIAKKILSCVYRVNESFGIAHVSAVLRGANTAAIRAREHDKLSTYGILKEHSQRELADWAGQLVGLGLVDQVGSEFPILKLNAASWEVMKDQRQARLRYIPHEKSRSADGAGREKSPKSRTEAVSWAGVDRELFEELRIVRQTLAADRGVPPYVIFGDATLRELARVRPSSLEAFGTIYGIGEARLRNFGERFFAALDADCRSRGLSRDNRQNAPAAIPAEATNRSLSAARAVELLASGATLDDVMKETNRARSTVTEYLCDFIRARSPVSVAAWVADDVYRKVADVAARLGADRLKPIFDELEGKIPYEDIRIVITHLTVCGG